MPLDENGRLLVFRGLEFIVYNIARCYGRGDFATCKASATSREFGFQLVDDVASLFLRPCPHIAGVRADSRLLQQHRISAAAIEANGGIDGALFTFSGAWTTPNLTISGTARVHLTFLSALTCIARRSPIRRVSRRGRPHAFARAQSMVVASHQDRQATRRRRQHRSNSNSNPQEKQRRRAAVLLSRQRPTAMVNQCQQQRH
jgi:hypothetical protein